MSKACARLCAIRETVQNVIFYSYKICKQCKWTYSSNLHSFNIRVNPPAERLFLTKSKDANHRMV